MLEKELRSPFARLGSILECAHEAVNMLRIPAIQGQIHVKYFFSHRVCKFIYLHGRFAASSTARSMNGILIASQEGHQSFIVQKSYSIAYH